MNINLKGREKKKTHNTLISEQSKWATPPWTYRWSKWKFKEFQERRTRQTPAIYLEQQKPGKFSIPQLCVSWLPTFNKLSDSRIFPILLCLSLFVACIISCLTTIYIVVLHLLRLTASRFHRASVPPLRSSG